ncbi:RBBP9/YdeN family alpha/beta hydrolase [Streptomyces genisteinicus]|uniref:Alpha/beta hydrolase n=1 Tax=Streptomyces genisteinicus TaxID=2768068 RepID=A0A7H0HMK8_9ACTN|nr:alpha/beta hydrolase [Streptomyces genisteinicus]QNP61774.1 alpha/beta hydrolase [Streptomyces genisteinicus]
MGNRSFLILHGVENHRPAGHWQHDLARRLRDRGEQVLYPQLPDPDRPSLEAWTAAVEDGLAAMSGERVVICHSLACVTWLHLAARSGGALLADRLLLVAPPGPGAFSWDVIAPFTPDPLDLTGLPLAAGSARLVCSDDDPYCPEGADTAYGLPLGCDTDVLPGTGHLAIPDGYGPWPSVLDWCLDGTVRLTARPTAG